MKIILPGITDEILEKELAPMRMIKVIEIQKELNGFEEAEEELKKQVGLVAIAEVLKQN